MEEDKKLSREEIEDILNRLHIEEYEWYIEDKEDKYLCSDSEEDAILVEKAIKGLINQYKTDYISKDKIRNKITELSLKNKIPIKDQFVMYDVIRRNFQIEILEDLLKE